MWTHHGATLGGILYEIGGFNLPFTVVGSFVMIALVAAMLTLHGRHIHKTEKEKHVPMVRIVKVPGVAIVGMCVITAGVLVSFIDSTLAVHLDHITNGKFTKAQTGTYFVFSVGFYTITAPFWGYIVENKLSKNHAMIIGHILILASFSLMGPASFLQPILNATPISTAISLCIFGISMGLFQVPVIGAMQMYAIESGLANGLPLNSMISGLYTSCINIIHTELIILVVFSFCKVCKA